MPRLLQKDRKTERRRDAEMDTSNVHLKIKKFECIICKDKFSCKASLDTHVSSVHDCEKQVCCEICQKMFGLHSDLMLHKKNKHLEQQLLLCSLCPRKYQSKDSLSKDAKMKHNTTTIQQLFMCTLCPRKYQSKESLSTHNKKKHNTQNPHLDANGGRGNKNNLMFEHPQTVLEENMSSKSFTEDRNMLKIFACLGF